MSNLQETKDLIAKRDAIDAKIEEYTATLTANSVDMKAPLVDAQDFPRNDINIYEVRDARVNIIRLRNDRDQLTKEIEEKISNIHTDTTKTDPKTSQTAAVEDDEPPVRRTTNKPILRISSVSEGSPAEEGGLEVDDLVIQFGKLHGDNFTGLEQLAEETKSYLGKVLKITVLRGTRVYRLQFHPREWAGRGIFGAGLLPLTTSQII
uniref:Nas2 N-terminal domain-containing protein n=1 Tax=Panagrolaimus sp. ES5 TaxID=591445 RepID=A0AC34FR28_9BILA